jgi:hypothetical protein
MIGAAGRVRPCLLVHAAVRLPSTLGPVEGPIPIARFSVGAMLRRRRVIPHSHSLYVARAVLGSLVIDASQLPVELGGTLGVIEAVVLGGRLEVVLPPGVGVRGKVRCGPGARVRSIGESLDDAAHIRLRATVILGRVDVRTVDPA